MSPIPLTRRIDVLGAINLVALGLHAVMSPLLAAVIVQHPRTIEMLAVWSAEFAKFIPCAGAGLGPRNPFATKGALFLAVRFRS
jgi:hypothetical protein